MDNGALVEELKTILNLNLSGQHAQVTLRLLALLAKLQELEGENGKAMD